MTSSVKFLALYFFLLSVCIFAFDREARAANLDELTVRIASFNATDRAALLAKGAKEEGKMVFYGTIPVNQFAVLGQAFHSRYPFISVQHYYSPRQGILNRALSEARAGRYMADAFMLDVSYGAQFIREGLAQPYLLPDRKKFYDGTYDKVGYWYSMYLMTTALVYNSRLVKPENVPRSYEDLLNPKWKGKFLFDPEAGYILAAMEHAWGRERAIHYLSQLSRQEISFTRGGTLTTQLVAAGEYPIAIAVVGETSAEMRERGAPLGFSVLAPKIIKPSAIFLARKAPNPHAALLFTEWVLSEEGQRFLATTLGKGVAMRGMQVKYKVFQVEPDFVVSPELGVKLAPYIKEFQKIFGIS